MLLQQNGKLSYMTRKIYGTQIFYECSANGIILFHPNKVRNIEVPESEEDKKYICILNCAKDIMAQRGTKTLETIIYDQTVTFEQDDRPADALNKIMNALITKLSITQTNLIDLQIIEILRKSIIRGNIDIY